MKEFQARNDCVMDVCAQLESRGLDPASAKQLAEAITDELEVPPETPPIGFPLRLGRWVIRDDDLKLIDAVVPTASVGILMAFQVAIAPAVIIGAAAALCKVLWSAHKKGILLTPEQQTIIVALKTLQAGSTVDELLTWLARNPQEHSWTKDKVEHELQHLKKIACPDGTVVSIVQQDALGKWYAAGV